MTSYATLEELLASYSLSTRPADSDPDWEFQSGELQAQLDFTTDALIDELSFDYFRHPAEAYDPDEVRLFDGRGKRRLHVHEGIVSLSAVEYRTLATDEWTEIDPDDWVLVAFYGRQGRPYDHLDLRTGTFPRGAELVQLTGVFGFETIPAAAKRANIAWARQGVSGSDSFSGGIVGPDELGRPVGPNRIPDAAYRLIERERRRYTACST